MPLITRTAGILACLICFHATLATADDLVLSSPALSVSVNPGNGNIDSLVLAANPDLNEETVAIIAAGGLLSSADFPSRTLTSQSSATDADGRQFIRTIYALDSSLALTRNIRVGASPYQLVVEFQLENLGQESVPLSALPLRFGIGFEGLSDPMGGYGSAIYAYRDLFLSRSGEAGRVDLEGEKSLSVDTAIDWVGWINRYHVLALRPQRNSTANSAHPDPVLSLIEASAEPPTPHNTVFSFTLPAALNAGESYYFTLEILAAPKRSALLDNVEPELGGVVLINLWDWFRWICFALGTVIYWLFPLTGNWGITLILMALVVRLITIPVTRASLKNQERAIAQQQSIAPKIKSLQESYKGVELSQKMVDLYETEKFDQLLPFKGMLGLFVQIPIFIALFNVLGEAPELSGASFLWVEDLARSDRLFLLGVDLPFFGGYFNLLPFVMGAVTVLSTWYASKNSTGQKMQYGALFTMAAVFFVLFYSFPAALVLYWTASNVFQLAQQIVEDYLGEHKEPASN